MRQGKLEDRLQMRRLTVDDTAQYNALLRYAFQVTDSELASLGWNQKEMERSKKPVLKKTESFGWFDGRNSLLRSACIRCRSICSARCTIWEA